MGRFAVPVNPQTAVAILAASIVLPLCVLGSRAASNPRQIGETLPLITLDYPSNNTLFPPDIIPPLFQWRDSANEVTAWRIQVHFVGRGPKIDVWSNGEKMQVGELDTTLVGYVPPELTPEQQAAHTWRPDPKVWETIKKHSVNAPATVTISGYLEPKTGEPVSRGQLTIRTSSDPVGAPILFRDVPLLPPAPEDNERGVIKPLPDSVLPKIKWELRDVSSTRSRVVMQGLPTCANCHSVSRDGKTLGIDVDGPVNDKGLYGLIPIRKVSTISNDYVIHWSDFSDPDKTAQKRFGFMSQVSPDGNYVVTSIDVPGALGRRVVDRLYNGFYRFFGFGQVFFPTRGVLAYYSRANLKLKPLPGADDPEYVQTSAFWSPDGKYLVYSRAKAKDPYYPGQVPSKYANDPNETQLQYDLYRIPFNEGEGGKPERVVGASENGMSNNFPKVSPDGKWIVFVENKNGLLMRPDSQLYIVPFEGGVARRLDCNQKIMNSWHTFSPNGRWLAFSSKSPNYYTKLYLTHIDKDGNDTPAILIENATAANRAVNIPEFVNIKPGDLERIDTPAVDFYRQFDVALNFAEKKQFDAASAAWKKALEMAPDDARAHNNYGVALMEMGRVDEAVPEFRRALELNRDSSQTHNNLGSALAEKGEVEEALPLFQKAVELNPDNGSAQVNLGNALALHSQRLPEALEHLRKGVELKSDSASGQNDLGIALARAGLMDEARAHLQAAVSLAPESSDYHYNLGRILAARKEFSEALPQFQQAASLSGMQQPAVLQMLAAMYSETGDYSEAINVAQRALDLAQQQHNEQLGSSLRANLNLYQQQDRSSQRSNSSQQ
ncbi:MAG TPA: tetratricopeptide repeat protein [Terriglobales bacterium]